LYYRIWREKVVFILVNCFFLLILVNIKGVFGWELEALQRRLQEEGAKWTAGEKSLSHLSKEEFKQMLGLKFHGRIKVIPIVSTKARSSRPFSLPSSLDWRDYNGVNWITPIKDQQQCGSCYSFATVGTMETLIKLDQSDPDFDVDLSEQYLVSCGPSGSRQGIDYGGCIGNYADYVSDFLTSTGVPDEACFPYDANQVAGSEPSCDEVCGDVASKVKKLSSWSYIAPQASLYIPQPDEIKAVLVNKPVPCGFLVYEDFQNYTGGVYEPLTGQEILGGHLVYIIGYHDSQSCWIVKNSWGTDWGESGFFKIAYNQTSVSSLTWFGTEALDFNYGESVTTSTIPPSSTTSTAISTTTTVPITTTTTTIAPEDMPNLAPCAPYGWSDPIVPSSQQGTNTYDPETNFLYPSPQKTYIDFALCNENNVDITDSFTVSLYIEGVEVITKGVVDVFDGKSYKTWLDEPFALSEGEHTLKLVVDVNNDIDEANESNNTYEKSFTWGSEKWSFLYSEMLGVDYQGDIQLLRNVRDKFLVTTKTGRVYVNLLYKNSAEIASLLSKDKDLRVRTASVVEQLIPELASLLNGEEAVMSLSMIYNVETLLDEFEVKASPGMKTAIKGVKRAIRKGVIFEQLGIKVGR
jgi:C1A family cysteine protease